MLCELALGCIGAAFRCEVPKLDILELFDSAEGILGWPWCDVIANCVLQISSSMTNYVYFHFELFLVLTHFVGDS